MNDDSLSASELRQRYVNKASDGGMSDDQLSASQIRARHAIERNSWEHQKQYNASSSSSSLFLLLGLLVLVLIVGGVVYSMNK